MKKNYFTIALLIFSMSVFSQTRYYVNDNNTAGDVFTTAVGNDANPGTAAAPLASIITAYLRTQPGDTIFVDAGTYTADGTIGKSLTILGTNYIISPNNAVNPLLPNTGRNTESIITNTTWAITVNNVNLEGLTFDPNSKTAVRTMNANNIRLSKNRFKINAANTQISFTGNGTFTILTSEIVNSGYSVTDNRFEKYDPSNGVTLNINRVKNVTITNNSFVTPGATLNTQLVLSAGTGGVTDGIVFSNNTVDKAVTVVGNGAAGNMVITGNKIYNTRYALRIDYSMSESSNFDFSNNLLDGGSGISPYIQFIKRGGFAPGSASSFRAENNTITGNAIPSVTSSMSSFYISFTNSVLNPSLALRRNKINYTGDYSTTNGQDINPFVLAGNINNANIENNEITITGINRQPGNPVNNRPVCPAVSLYPENGFGGVVQPGAIINVLNNKVDGFKQSFVVFDPFDIVNGGVDNYTGYGNLNPLALLKVNYNSFTNDSMSVNNGNNPDNDLDVHCNWYGSSADQDIITKISYQSITAIPWLTNGTDNDPATGFQPVPGTCDGYPPMIVLNSYTNVTCTGANNGTINITASSGKAPFTFTWTKDGSPGFISHDEDLVNLAPGTYHLSVVDGNGSTIFVNANGDINSIEVTIGTDPDTQLPVINCPASVTINFGESIDPSLRGSATATDNCTNVNITYTDISTQTASGNGHTNYVITRTWKATDGAGNIATCNQMINVCQMSISLGINRYVLYGALGYTGCGILTPVITGGLAPFTYSWTSTDPAVNGSTASSITSCSTTELVRSYNVVVTAANGCTATATVSLTFININCSNNGNNVKVLVCHRPPGNPGNCQTICVSINAYQTLLDNGSYLGNCLPLCEIPLSARSGNSSISQYIINDELFNVKVMNNPTGTFFKLYVSGGNFYDKINIRVIDISGRVIEQRSIMYTENEIKLGEKLFPGVYLAEITKGVNRKTVKLIKQ